MPAPTTVAEYLAGVPEADRVALEHLRQLIRETAPQAEEAVSYGIPLYRYRGHLVGFGAFKKHLSLFVTRSEVIERFAEELGSFQCSGTTIHFTAEHPLPDGLVRSIVEVRLAENEAA